MMLKSRDGSSATPQANTKVEVLAEAIEDLVMAVAVAASRGGGGPEGFKTVADARKVMRDALADFLKPTLRVVGE